MEQSRENHQVDLVVSNSATSLEECIHTQKDLFCSQIDELKNIVLTQCKLTGVNPLSQEMAAGALSIKIGKRPRDLLNPKALKYMQSIFSIKDAISKKETREISALFGVTATQVREFFTSQRTRVRKFVRLARDRANRSSSGKEVLEVHEGIPPPISDPNEPLDPVPLDSVAPISTEEGPTCSKEDEVLPSVDESDKHFVENIFSLMRKEETFSGQVKLMEWILQIQNSSILYWFLTKGGIMILATWLSQSVVEEQTSVLHVILKVLCHLPLQKALPVHMSAVLQSVNRLRFYRASDISNRAKILLSRWSKAFARSQALKKKNGTKSASDSQDEILLKQSISEVMGNGSWDCRNDAIEDVSMPLDESSGTVRKLESQPLKLLTASSDDTNKKLISGVRSSQNRERRTVLFVEQPGQKSAGRSSHGRATAVTQGRPLSADDIQKAKMRAQFMQNKYGKSKKSSDESSLLQLEAANKINTSQMSSLQSASKAHSGHLIEEQKKSETSPLTISNLQDALMQNKPTSNAEEPPQKKCKRLQIPWQSPPEIILSVSWRVGAGENSKEVEIQKKRIHREREIVYKSIHEIPSDPREPWDREIDYDDTLTPEIPIEQLPDTECAETSVCHKENEGTATGDTNLSFQNAGGGSMAEPDMELLAVLLKNPELVFALTSGQANNLSNEETVKLLDMIKANSSSSSSLSVLGGNRKTEEKVEVSLPSPTPSSNPVTNGWKTDLTKNPFSRQTIESNEMQGIAGIAAGTAIRSQQQSIIPGSSLVYTTVQPTTRSTLVVGEHSKSVLPFAQQTLTAAAQPQVLSQQLGGSVTQQLSLLQSAIGQHENIASPSLPGSHAYTIATHMQQQLAASEFLHKTNTARSNIHSTPAAMQVETVRVVSSSAALPNNVLGGGTPPRPLSSWANHSSYAPEPPASSHSWRPRQAMDQISYHQSNMNLNNYNPLSRGGSVRAPMQTAGSWERNEVADEHDFESWSPENSPIRSHRYNNTNNNNNSHGWNFPQSRLNPGYSYSSSSERPKNHGYHPSTPGYRGGNNRWNDRGSR